MTERPAWWETPRRSAVRACLWLGALVWALASVPVAFRAHSETQAIGFFADCRAPTTAAWITVGIALAGAGLIVLWLQDPDARFAKHHLAVVAIFVLWLLAVFVWLPALTPVCGN